MVYLNLCFQLLNRSKKVSVPSTVISRVIGRGGCNINAIREFTGAHIDIDKQKDKTGDRIITIRQNFVSYVFFLCVLLHYSVIKYKHLSFQWNFVFNSTLFLKWEFEKITFTIFFSDLYALVKYFKGL